MEQKIKPKDLSYDSTLPPFLQRLRALHSSNTADGRHERPQSRPKRVRTEEDEEEDEPTYVAEDGTPMSHSEMLEMGKNAQANARHDAENAMDLDTEMEGVERNSSNESNEREISRGTMGREKEKLAAIGAGRRRKVGRVIGADVSPDSRGASQDRGSFTASTENQMRDLESDAVTAQIAPKPKPKKNMKKVKLSFGDDEEM